jgi:Na+-driven multidrug efflux pump
MRVRDIFTLWFPLALSFELMMLEGPVIQGAMGLLADPALNLAAFGLTMALSLLVESPVIMLLATAIALVKDRQSFEAIRRFTVYLALACTAVTALVAFTPLFGFITETIMRQPPEIARAAQPAMQIMLLWTAAIAWRRSYQGVLVRSGRTRLVTWGTAVRLVAAVATALLIGRFADIPGAQLGAWALMAAVVTEAFATTLFARKVIRREFPASAPGPDAVTQNGLSQRDIFRFHAPLAATTLLTLLAQPLTSAALGRLPNPVENLAAWPVAFMLLLVIRGGAFALQEITVSQARRPEAAEPLRRFTLLVGAVLTLVTAAIAFTPLADLYMTRAVHLPPDLHGIVRIGLCVGLGLPMITALCSWARGLLVAAGRTKEVYRGMGVNLTLHVALLAACVPLRVPGMWAAAGTFTLASVAEYLFLHARVRALRADRAAVPVPGAVGAEA